MSALARRTDPTSSHLAAKAAEGNGTAEAHRVHVLKLIKQRPGSTAYELAELDKKHSAQPLSQVQILRRTHELADEKVGLIRRGYDLRECSVCGRLCTTWYPKD